MIEPDAQTIRETTSSIIITLKDDTQVWMHKELVNQKLNPRTEVRYSRGHTHRGVIKKCWDCGNEFCYSCKGVESDWQESHCGCKSII